jgi:hypothetical protein
MRHVSDARRFGILLLVGMLVVASGCMGLADE